MDLREQLAELDVDGLPIRRLGLGERYAVEFCQHGEARAGVDHLGDGFAKVCEQPVDVHFLRLLPGPLRLVDLHDHRRSGVPAYLEDLAQLAA
jgi:hypothetical protein